MTDREHTYDPADDASLVAGGAGAGAGDGGAVEEDALFDTGDDASPGPADDDSFVETARSEPDLAESALDDAVLGETAADRRAQPDEVDAQPELFEDDDV